MSKEQEQQNEAVEIEINAKQEPIDLDSGKPEPVIDEDNPRSTIYKKYSEKRKAEGEGTAIGTEKPVEAEPGKPQEPEPEKEILVKVNGKEKMVPASKIEAAGGIEAYRKNAAASELLNQAAAERREIEAQKLQLATREQEIQREREELQRERQNPVAAQEDMKALAQKYHEAILEGEMDAASELLIKMQSARGDGEEIAKRAAAEARDAIKQERAIERQQQFETERQEAVAWFESECEDINSDQELRNMADKKTLELLQENPKWGPKKIIEESARIVRDWMNDKGIGNKLPSDKLEAKRQLTVVKGGSARAVPRQASKAPTSSQYIESLRKARGLE